MPDQPTKRTWKAHPRVLQTCPTCGTERWVSPSRVRGPGYCDRRCRWPLTEEQRFFTHVVCDLETGCWLWTASALSGQAGYGGFARRHRQSALAHHVSWEFAYGPIPPGLNVLHRCDVRICVRPDHLFLGTQLDNVQDRDAKGRGSYGELHHHAKLTDADVVAIRQRWPHGATQACLAHEFGVRPSQIANIVHRRSWKHLD